MSRAPSSNTPEILIKPLLELQHKRKGMAYHSETLICKHKTLTSISISLKSITSQPTDPPFLKNLSTHLFVELNRIHIPIKHAPLHSPIPHFHRLSCHRRQQHLPKPFPPVAIPDIQILYIEPWLPQERRIIWEKQHEPCHHGVAARSEFLRFRVCDGEI